MRFLKYLAVCVMLAASIGFLYIRYAQEPEAVQRPSPPVTVVEPVLGSLSSTITLGGHIESESTITVLPRVSGLLETLHVESGDLVQAGEIIAEIDTETLQLQLMQAEAAFRSAKSVYDRTARLYESRTATLQEYDQAKSQFEAYSAQYDLAKLQLSYASIRSPMDGVVLVRHASQGSLVSPQVPIVTIGSARDLKITSRLPERYYDLFTDMQEEIAVQVSRPVRTAGNSSGPIEASVSRISPFVSAETRKFEVISRITEGATALRPGMYVNVNYVLDEVKDVYSLPQSAYVAGGFVWYVDESSQARRLQIGESFITEERFSIPPEYRELRFICEGQHFLQEGQKVRITGIRTP